MNYAQRYMIGLSACTILVLFIVLNVSMYLAERRTDAMYPRLTTSSAPSAPAVPKRLFQTYHTPDLPPRMQATVDGLRAAHPDFEYVFHTDADSQRFLQQHFPPAVVAAYNTLIPGAYKADLWRLCVLYKLGGVYLDIKLYCVPPFTFHALLDGPHFAKDYKDHGIYNAVMVCPPGDARLLRCIDTIVEHVRTKFYGDSCLSVTGPKMVARFIDRDGSDVDMKLTLPLGIPWLYSNMSVKHRGRPHQTLVKAYSGYRGEQRRTQRNKRYGVLWKQRKIYTA